jgi:hypothetical protein
VVGSGSVLSWFCSRLWDGIQSRTRQELRRSIVRGGLELLCNDYQRFVWVFKNAKLLVNPYFLSIGQYSSEVLLHLRLHGRGQNCDVAFARCSVNNGISRCFQIIGPSLLMRCPKCLLVGRCVVNLPPETKTKLRGAFFMTFDPLADLRYPLCSIPTEGKCLYFLRSVVVACLSSRFQMRASVPFGLSMRSNSAAASS